MPPTLSYYSLFASCLYNLRIFCFFINWTQAYHCFSMKISFTDRSEKSFMQVVFTILSLYLLMVIATISWLFLVDIMTICKTETEKNEFIQYTYIHNINFRAAAANFSRATCNQGFNSSNGKQCPSLGQGRQKYA